VYYMCWGCGYFKVRGDMMGALSCKRYLTTQRIEAFRHKAGMLNFQELGA
jgi:hypothetical protein